MKLLILGNGFDISHKLPCKYSDFYKYLFDNQSDILECIEKFYDIDSQSELWCDFETSLEKHLIYDSLTEIIVANAPNFLSDDFSDGDWIDAQICIERECDELLKNITIGFENWINSLEIENVHRVYNLSKSDYYLTFNYTVLLEYNYRIPNDNVFHIHNKVGDELIFGHGKSLRDFNVKNALYGNKYISYDDYGNIESGRVGHEQFAEDAVCAFHSMMRKPIEEVMKNNEHKFQELQKINEVIILGHSFNDIDLPYFRKIVESISNTAQWTLLYYSDRDLELAKFFANNLNLNMDLVEFKHVSEFQITDTQLRLFE